MADDIWTPFTADNLIRYYHDLSEQERRIFRDQFLPVLHPNASGMMRLLRAMPEEDMILFLQEVWHIYFEPSPRKMTDKFLPGSVQDHLVPQVQEILQDQKQKRDRKPDPETVRQDEEIYTLRNSNKQQWTWKRLGWRFGMTEAAARQAYDRHQQRTEKRSN
jgi:hypothetical protein